MFTARPTGVNGDANGMTAEQILIFAVLAGALVLFVWGKWRYDVVALAALLAVTLPGLVAWEEAFLGFGHPAVITVAAVLIVGRALANSGVVGLLARQLSRVGTGTTAQITGLTVLVAVLSAFMNNVGALALLMPVAVRMARKNDRSPSLYLMPLAFGSLLGGLSTLIGTPPNIIIATFRQDATGEAFRMFEFTPVGAGIGVAGVLFVSLVGWRILPRREGQASREQLFRTGEYLTEVLVPEDSPLVGKSLREVEREAEHEILVAGLVRGERRQAAPAWVERVRAGDILIVSGESEDLREFVEESRVEFAEDRELDEEVLGSDDVELMEVVVTPNSRLVGRDPRDLRIRIRFGMNILAVARQGARLKERIAKTRFRVGDVLLVQGPRATLFEAVPSLGLLPIAERDLTVGNPRKAALAVGIFGAAVALAAFGLLEIQIAFVAAAVGVVVAGLISLEESYASVDWPVIVLLGAMIPVGQALETTGAAALVGDGLLDMTMNAGPAVAVGAVLVVTMLLSDVINNAAAAVLMAPVSLAIAAGIGGSPDPFLMAVAVGASCAFLTPIGHQSNTLVLGPGGYRFGDYWKLGLPLEVVILVVGVPLILWVWPV
jgi:di/tricarboxylate transporter